MTHHRDLPIRASGLQTNDGVTAAVRADRIGARKVDCGPASRHCAAVYIFLPANTTLAIGSKAADSEERTISTLA